jgi:hypothetical protein
MKTKKRLDRMAVEKQSSPVEKEREGKGKALASSQSIANLGMGGIISAFLGR